MSTTIRGGGVDPHPKFERHMRPIEVERSGLADWEPQTMETGWQTTGQVSGGIAGLVLGAAVGTPLMRSHSLLPQVVGLGVSLVAGITAAAWGARQLGALTGRLDGPRPDAAKVEAAHERTVSAYEEALDDAELAVRTADSDRDLDQAWGALMQARPDGLPVPDAIRGAEGAEIGDYTYMHGYGVVPELRYGS